jgi:hypothetical protein
MPSQEVTSVSCPQCGFRYNTPIQTLLNIKQNPQLKPKLLQGQLNLSQCPQCNFQGPLNLPLFYYDPDKELALALVPSELHLPHTEEQRIIGDLTNRIMNQLPPAERKAYLLNPKTFISRDSLAKAILEADGITEEMLTSQAEKMQLLDQFMQTRTEADLKTLITQNETALDYQFYEILTATAMQAMQSGNEQVGHSLLALRQAIAQYSQNGQTIVAELDENIGLRMMTPENYLEDLLSAESDEEFRYLVQAGQGMLDYQFFQELTAQIDQATAAGNTATATKLQTLRSRLLDTTSQLENEQQTILTKVNQLIQAIFTADDPQAYISDNLEQFDDSVMAILAANMQHAQEHGHTEQAEQLALLSQMIINAIQENMPPEMAFLSQLMEAESPEAIDTLLNQNRGLLTPEFSQLLAQLKQDFQQEGNQEATAIMSLIEQKVASKKQIFTL